MFMSFQLQRTTCVIGISTGLSVGTILKLSGLRIKQFVDTDCLTVLKNEGRFFHATVPILH